MLFDTHCHLTDPAFDPDREVVLSRAREAGVVGMVCIASHPDDALAALALARTHPDIWSTVGIHPHEAQRYSPEAMDGIRRTAEAESRVVALGETGLDHFYDHAPRDIQKRSFEAHLALGVELDLPVVVHCRNADREMEAMLRNAPPESRGVLHCFSGDEPLLDVALERGWSVSFGGVVTFKRFEGGDLLRAVPVDRLMLETDSPYLAPVPFRGKRNEPAHVARVLEVAAELRGEDPGVLADTTTENARRFFGLGGGAA
jgi:TatD DNase family protein